MRLSSFESKQVPEREVSEQLNKTETTHQKCGQSQILHMGHQFEMYKDKQVKLEDMKGGTGVLTPVLPMKPAV